MMALFYTLSHSYGLLMCHGKLASGFCYAVVATWVIALATNTLKCHSSWWHIVVFWGTVLSFSDKMVCIEWTITWRDLNIFWYGGGRKTRNCFCHVCLKLPTVLLGPQTHYKLLDVFHQPWFVCPYTCLYVSGKIRTEFSWGISPSWACYAIPELFRSYFSLYTGYL